MEFGLFYPLVIEACEGQRVVLNLNNKVWPEPCIQWQVCISKDQDEVNPDQWQVGLSSQEDGCISEKECNWINLRGQTKPILSFIAQRNQTNNKYRAFVRTECECWFTNSAKLDVGFLDIIQQPQSVCFDEGETATFTIIAEGNPEPTYQWHVVTASGNNIIASASNYSTNGGATWTDLPGETSNTLEVLMNAASQNNLYRVIVQNRCETVISNTVRFLPEGSLIIDDGIWDFSSGSIVAQQLLWLNRFTPSSYPFILEEIQVYFSSTSSPGSMISSNVNVGDPIDLYVWENKSGNFNPFIGAVFRGSLSTQVLALDTFNSYILPTSIYFDGPNDILIGVVNRLPISDPRYALGYEIVSIDTTNPQFRSWTAFYPPDNIAPNPPTFPPPLHGFDGGLLNWMIRGIGCGGSQAPDLNPSPPVRLALASTKSTLLNPNP